MIKAVRDIYQLISANPNSTRENPNSIHRKALEIMQGTNSGDTLDMVELMVIEGALLGILNEKGRMFFENMYNRISFSNNAVA